MSHAPITDSYVDRLEISDVTPAQLSALCEAVREARAIARAALPYVDGYPAERNYGVDCKTAHGWTK